MSRLAGNSLAGFFVGEEVVGVVGFEEGWHWGFGEEGPEDPGHVWSGALGGALVGSRVLNWG